MSSDPNDWQTRPFREVAAYAPGHTPARANPAYWDQSGELVPWVTISDLTPYGRVVATKESANAAAIETVFRGEVVPAGTLLMSFKLTIGRVATLEVPAVHNEAIIAIYPRSGIDQRFLGYYLSQVDYSQVQDRQIKGNTLNRAKLDRIPILVPSELEQREIVFVLDAVRSALTVHTRLEEAAAELKRAAMHTLFQSGLGSGPQRETEIGLIPDAWELWRCEDLSEEITVGVVVKPASYYVADGVPAFRSLNVKEDRLDTGSLVQFSAADNETVLAKSRLRAGDVLVVRTGYPGTSCVVPPEFDKANCIDLVIVRPNIRRILGSFLSRFLNSDGGRSQAILNSHGLAQKHLNVGAVRSLKVPVPQSLDEQAEIVEILEALDRKVDLHRRRRHLLEELFQSVLQGLMSGALRVKDLEIPDLSVEACAGEAVA